MPDPIYKRVIVKLSGEALNGDKPFGIDQATVERIAADLAATARLALPHEASLTAPVVTLSMGIATLPPEEGPEHTPEALLAAADQALYRATKGGRNRFERAV